MADNIKCKGMKHSYTAAQNVKWYKHLEAI